MEQKDLNLAEFIAMVEGAMKVIHRYEASRPSSFSFQKLEEAILWAQVMVTNVALKEVNDGEKSEIISNAA